MRFPTAARRGVTLAAAASASVLMLTACSAGSLGSSEGGEGGEAAATTITLPHGADDSRSGEREGSGEAFQAANPSITIKHETRPGGSEGDNLVKTRLATGDMADVFIYNNGSLLQAIKPEQNLTPLDDQPWAGQLDELFADVDQGLRRQAVRRTVRYGLRRRCALQHPDLQEAQPGDPEDLGRVHGQQREDQGRRQRRPRRADVRRTPGPPSCSFSATTTTSSRPCRPSPRTTPPTRPSTRPRRRRWPGSSTSRRSRTPATSTRTSPRPS